MTSRTPLTRILMTLLLLMMTCSAPRMAAGEPSGTAHLTLWVPAGEIGRTYWLYLNGHLVRERPRVRVSGATNFVAVKTTGGYEIWGQQGLILGTHWASRAVRPRALDRLNLFEPISLTVPSGTYRIELAAPITDETKEFALVFSDALSVVAERGDNRAFFLEIPPAYVAAPFSRAHAANRLCDGGTSQPSAATINALTQQLTDYLSDPLELALQSAVVTLQKPQNGTISIALPLQYGGTREFDADEIERIVSGLRRYEDFPERAEVDICREKYPQLSSWPMLGTLVDTYANAISIDALERRMRAQQRSPR